MKVLRTVATLVGTVDVFVVHQTDLVGTALASLATEPLLRWVFFVFALQQIPLVPDGFVRNTRIGTVGR